MTTALTPYASPAQHTLQEMLKMGELFYQSGLFADIRGAAQATTKIIAGQELGIPPFASMNGFHIIKGKAAMGANLIGAKVKASGKYDYIVRVMTPDRCDIEFFQLISGKRESIGSSEFTIADAKKAGTQNLDKFPRNMLFARAMSNGARWYTPDVFLGPIYTPEELGAAVDEAGDVIPGASFAPEQLSEPQIVVTEATPNSGPPASDKQRGFIAGLTDKIGWSSEQLAEFARQQRVDLVAMSKNEASALIEQLQHLATEQVQPDPKQVASLKKLRACEINTSGEPPKFTQKQASDAQAVDLEWIDSRARIYMWIKSKIEAAPALEELDDQGLIDLAIATKGL